MIETEEKKRYDKKKCTFGVCRYTCQRKRLKHHPLNQHVRTKVWTLVILVMLSFRQYDTEYVSEL